MPITSRPTGFSSSVLLFRAGSCSHVLNGQGILASAFHPRRRTSALQLGRKLLTPVLIHAWLKVSLLSEVT